ncbi:MAG: error-prone DNA polymerase [Phycisphaerae bacterium]
MVSRAAYAELTVASNFTFLTGASHPDELVFRAAELGLHAIAITDRNSLAGVVRAHVAAKECGMRLIVGSRLIFTDVPGLSLFVYPTDRAGYGRLCSLLTRGKRRAPKGECYLQLADLRDFHAGLLAVALWDECCATNTENNIVGDRLSAGQRVSARNPDRIGPDGSAGASVSHLTLRVFPGPASSTEASRHVGTTELKEIFDDDRLSLAVTQLFEARTAAKNARIAQLARECDIPLVAINDVHYHDAARRGLQDVLTCVRHGCTIEAAGLRLFANAERHLKAPADMARLFADFPQAIARTIAIADRAGGFSLDELRYEYPEEVCPRGMSDMEYLRDLTWRGARERFPDGVPAKVRKQIEHEFDLIRELNYAPYFLTVHDIVRFTRQRGILCQGRGAAANSAVCYCLGVTAVDPARVDMLFERFVSRERNEPPDIDIDCEHERREEVIQYIYRKYGRDRAGLTAVVVTYRGRSAVRDVGKALGLSLDAVDKLAKHVSHWATKNVFTDDQNGDDGLRELGFDPASHTMRNFVRFVGEILGFPRHLSQHVGGFVITRGPLRELVPIENAAMEERTIIEWDKDDIEALGILKVDVLGLGMLSCIRKCFELIEQHHGESWSLATIPANDEAVYDMICRADTVGVFQIESRAQMTMLPRLRPRCYYDLVIEVAIVRPGPIVGNMVHPYLRRRTGDEEPYYPDDKVKSVLQKTLGVPLFQEQAMALAIVAAGFTPGEAEMLRRAITAWKSQQTIAKYRTRFIEGMVLRRYDREFAEQCFEQLKGFSEYGFPESHAASFALLVYASSWLKHHYPAAFATALINSQPMGFYAPAQIVRDAQDHGVRTLPVDVNFSDWDCTLEQWQEVVRGADADEHWQQAASGTQIQADQSRPDRYRDEEAEGTFDLQSKVQHSSKREDCAEPRSNRDRRLGRSLTLPLENGWHGGEAKGGNHVRSAGTSVSHEDVRHGGVPTKVGTTMLRLGMRMVKGLREEHARAVVAAVQTHGPFRSPTELWRWAGIPASVLHTLAQADAFGSMGLTRQRALWEVQSLHGKPQPLWDTADAENASVMTTMEDADQLSDANDVAVRRVENPPHKDHHNFLPPVPPLDDVVRDYSHVGLSLKAHPLCFLRDSLRRQRVRTAAEVRDEKITPHKRWASVAGIVLFRQRPGTAKGVIFMTLEDETGRADLIIRKEVQERFRKAIFHGQVLVVRGRVERNGLVVHMMVHEVRDISEELAKLRLRSRDFR